MCFIKRPTDSIKKIILSDKKYPWARPPQKPTRVLVKVASCSSAEAPTEWFRYILLMGMDDFHRRPVLTPCKSRQIQRMSIKDIWGYVITAFTSKTS